MGEQLRAFSSALLGFLCFLDLLDLPELLGLQLYDCLDLWWGFLDLCDCWDLCDFFECLNLGREAPLTAAGALRPTIYNTKQHKSRLSAVVKLTTIIDRHQNRTTHTHTHTHTNQNQTRVNKEMCSVKEKEHTRTLLIVLNLLLCVLCVLLLNNYDVLCRVH